MLGLGAIGQRALIPRLFECCVGSSNTTIISKIFSKSELQWWIVVVWDKKNQRIIKHKSQLTLPLTWTSLPSGPVIVKLLYWRIKHWVFSSNCCEVALVHHCLSRPSASYFRPWLSNACYNRSNEIGANWYNENTYGEFMSHNHANSTIVHVSGGIITISNRAQDAGGHNNLGG